MPNWVFWKDPDAYSAESFRRLVLTEFPQLQSDFEESAGLLHVQMGDFRSFTQKAMDSGQWDVYERCVGLANELWTRSDSELENALYVSFIENMCFGGENGEKGWALLPEALQRRWQEMEDYFDRTARPPIEGKEA